MDHQRFDDLAKALGKTTSRRQVLKGLAGAALGGLLAQIRSEDAAAKPKPPKPEKPDHCRPEGQKSKDASRCCSLTTADGVCCAVGLHDSCAASGCCGDNSICENGACCLPEGAFLGDNDVTACCSESAMGDFFQVCCARGIGDSCAVSRCCGEGVCFQGTCVECLPEGANFETEGYDVNACCSQAGFPILDICCGEADGSCAASRCCAGDQVCHQDTCVDCLPDGARIADTQLTGSCCSGASIGPLSDTGEILCCGETDGSCAASECCASGQVCHQGTCVDCLPEGTLLATPQETGSCCSGASIGPLSDTGEILCCGETDGSCASSQCCASGQICHAGTCVDCLPEGANHEAEGHDASACCSGTSSDDVCCADGIGDSCAISGCCGGDLRCFDGVCVECLPDGAPTDSAFDCCSLAASGGICCGEIGGSCAASGCCEIGGTCCNGTCHEPCPEGQPRDPDTCACEPGLEDGDDCTESGECLSAACCGGICVNSQSNPAHCGGCDNACLAGEICRDGGCCRLCNDGTCCESGLNCLCTSGAGCVCCAACPAGSEVPTSTNCRGGCGDCCEPCFFAGGFACCGPFKETLNPSAGCRNGPLR